MGHKSGHNSDPRASPRARTWSKSPYHIPRGFAQIPLIKLPVLPLRNAACTSLKEGHKVMLHHAASSTLYALRDEHHTSGFRSAPPSGNRSPVLTGATCLCAHTLFFGSIGIRKYGPPPACPPEQEVQGEQPPGRKEEGCVSLGIRARC